MVNMYIDDNDDDGGDDYDVGKRCTTMVMKWR